MENTKKAVIYARQSSGSDDFSESVENQIENCKKLAIKENLEVIGIYSDLNTSGKTYPCGAESFAKNDSAFIQWFNQQTGTKMFRQGLGEVVARLSEVDFIIVDDMTRLYRPVTRSFLENYINSLLTDNSVSILQVKGGKLDLSMFDSVLIQSLKNQINDEQIKNQKMKSMQQLKKRKDSGFYANGTSKAWGTEYNRIDGSITIKDDCLEVVNFIFESIKNYVPYCRIIKTINSKWMDKFSGKCCYETNIYHIARNPIYAGYMFNSEGFLIKNKQIQNPCISFSEWSKIQKIMDEKKKNPPKAKHNFLPFTGKIFCGECGSKLVSGIDKGKSFYYCKAGTDFRPADGCKGSRVYLNLNTDDFCGLMETINPLLVMAYFQQMTEIEQSKNKSENLEKLKIEAENLKSKKDQILKMFLSNLINSEEMESALIPINNQQKKIQAEIVQIESALNPDDVFNHLKMIEKKWNLEKMVAGEYSNAEFQSAFNAVINRIDVYSERIRVQTVFGELTIPRKIRKNKKHFPKNEVIINGKKNLQVIVIYYTGTSGTLLDSGKVKIITR